jgi:mono/diheme cytochrome c family protein
VPVAADNPPIGDPGAPIAHADDFGAETRVAASENAPSATPPSAPENKTAAPTGGAPSAATPSTGGDKAAATTGGAPSAAQSGSAVDIAKSAEKGSLKSPYADYKKVAEEGHQKFMSAGCNGCHGGGGGGGMGPPLTNEIWIYGKDDDTLFRLIALGSDELQKQGYSRKGSEHVVGPMPQMGTVMKSADDEWKIIAWIRSVNPSSAASGSSAAATPSTPAPQYNYHVMPGLDPGIQGGHGHEQVAPGSPGQARR